MGIVYNQNQLSYLRLQSKRQQQQHKPNRRLSKKNKIILKSLGYILKK